MATSLLKTIGLSFAGSTISFLSDLILGDEWSVEVLQEQDKSGKTISFYKNLQKELGKSETIQDIVNTWERRKNISTLNEGSEGYVKIADFDSFISMNGVSDSQIVENAIEQGSFRSVNKVIKPKRFTIELARGGGFKFLENGIKNMLYNLEQYQGSTILCRVITPYGVINNLNLVKLEYSFTQDVGSCLLIARMTFQEVMGKARRQKVRVEKVKNASLAETIDSGEKFVKGV